MVSKVGSAGHVIDSVIQYPQNTKNQRPAESADAKTSENKKSGTLLMAKSDDRVIKSSEYIDSSNSRPATHSKNKIQAPSSMDNLPAIETNTVESAESEINRKNRELELSLDAIKITVEDVNKKLAPTSSEVEFSFHEKTGRYSFKVLDKDTGKVIREVPPEKSLDMVAKMFEMVGILVDEKL